MPVGDVSAMAQAMHQALSIHKKMIKYALGMLLVMEKFLILINHPKEVIREMPLIAVVGPNQ